MILLLALSVFLLLLHLPVIGTLLTHGLNHALIHFLEHHHLEVALAVAVWALAILLTVLLFGKAWVAAANAIMFLLIFKKILSSGH